MTIPAISKLAALTLLCFACGPASEPIVLESEFPSSVPGYALNRPSLYITLPPALREISALTDVDGETVACLTDEKGRLYFVDLALKRKIERAKFGPDGDYEGLTRVGANYFVVRSDGAVLEVAPEDGSLEIVSEFRLDVPHVEIESLAYDSRNERLLFAPKGKAIDKSMGKNDRPIFAFDLETRRALKEPLLVLSRKRIIKEAEEKGFALPTRVNKKGETKASFKLGISSLGVHPLTHHIYLLSGPDRTLFVIDWEGELLGTHVFAENVLPQPEGLTFQADGSLILSSEGLGQPPVLLLFRHLPLAE